MAHRTAEPVIAQVSGPWVCVHVADTREAKNPAVVDPPRFDLPLLKRRESPTLVRGSRHAASASRSAGRIRTFQRSAAPPVLATGITIDTFPSTIQA